MCLIHIEYQDCCTSVVINSILDRTQVIYPRLGQVPLDDCVRDESQEDNKVSSWIQLVDSTRESNSHELRESHDLSSHLPKELAKRTACSTGHPDTCPTSSELAQEVNPKNSKDHVLCRQPIHVSSRLRVRGECQCQGQRMSVPKTVKSRQNSRVIS